MIKKKGKLCIIGSAPSKADAPYADAEYDIWAISGAVFSESLGIQKFPETDENKWNSVHRVDVFFEMHKRYSWESKLERLASCSVPVVMQCREYDIPTSEAYQLDVIAADVGEEFTSSIAYMMAMGIHLGYEEISVYGVNLMHDSEYASQRPAFKYYLGVARERGIFVWAPAETRLTVPAWRYGYDDIDATCGKLAAMKAKLEDDANKQKQVVEDARQGFFQLRGAATLCGQLIEDLKGGLT